jgi:dUTP pyrophosphatase
MIKLEIAGEGNCFYATSDSAGFDVCSQEDVIIPASEYKLITTGLRIVEHSVSENADINGKHYRVIPEIQIRPRSGLAAKYGVTILNSPATVDADYRGIIMVQIINHSKVDFVIKKGDRIAQGVCAFTLQLPCVEVKSKVRGEGGHGSTGV